MEQAMLQMGKMYLLRSPAISLQIVRSGICGLGQVRHLTRKLSCSTLQPMAFSRSELCPARRAQTGRFYLMNACPVKQEKEAHLNHQHPPTTVVPPVNIPIPTKIDYSGCTHPKVVPMVLNHGHMVKTAVVGIQLLATWPAGQ